MSRCYLVEKQQQIYIKLVSLKAFGELGKSGSCLVIIGHLFMNNLTKTKDF